MPKRSGQRDDHESFARLIATIRELREKCPWDREQKLGDTSRHLLEEAYEVVDAIASGHPADIAEELGDLIVQALFTATIASEADGPAISKLMEDAAQKLVRRHPHVYGESKATTIDEVLELWERIKDREKKKPKKRSSLEKTGRTLPSLMRAEKLGVKARRLGMDWQDPREVLAKIREELDEVEHALNSGDQSAAAEEVGDMMLAVANLPRFLGRDAEQTLRQSCEKFVARFGEVERISAERGLKLTKMSPAQLESLWQEAKKSLEHERD